MNPITVSYKDGATTNARDDEAAGIARRFQAVITGSGFGFGERDLEYDVPTSHVIDAMRAFLDAGFSVHSIAVRN